jgi:micrococcal nuclease
MTAIFLIGFLIFLFSLIYLAFHFTRKLKDRSRTLSKKIFYPSLIGGLLLFIIGGSYMDTGVQVQLDEAIEDNKKLTAENKKLKAEIKDLQGNIKELTTANKKLENDFKEVSTKVEVFEKEKEDLNNQITDLEAKNKSLNNEISSLKSQLASKNKTTTAASSNSSSSSNNTASSSNNSSQSSGSENFANCTELRNVYPNGVPAGHAAYQSKMDRDKDGYACER